MCTAYASFLPPPFLPSFGKQGYVRVAKCELSHSPENNTPPQSPPPKRPYGYWTHLPNVLRELEVYLSEHPTLSPGVMPTATQLTQDNRRDLAGAIRRHKWPVVAEAAGLVLSSIARPRSLNLVYCTTLRSGRMRPYMYWRDFGNLKREVLDHMRETGSEKIPSAASLEKAGRSDIGRAIRMHGGWSVLQRRLQEEEQAEQGKEM